MDRRDFVKAASSLAAISVLPRSYAKAPDGDKLFDIALSQWAFHRSIFGDGRDNYEWFIKTLHSDPDAVLKGDMDLREIVVVARKLGVNMVDLANVLWFGHAQDKPWLRQLKNMANAEGIGFTCLMCDELAEYTQQFSLELLVENHGHPSSNGA